MSIFIVFKIYKTLKMPETVVVSGIFYTNWQLLKIRTILPIVKTAN